MSEADWDGVDRRNCPGCKNVEELDIRVTKCKEQFESELGRVHQAVAILNKEVHGLRGDVHGMGESMTNIKTSLADIAATLRQLADLPEAWNNLKGFLAVLRWVRENLLLLALVGAVTAYAMRSYLP